MSLEYNNLFEQSFPKEYYAFLWGTVHNHDYAENQANLLVELYGKVKYLDVGCGCGVLVKALRERGCEAWGIEVSDYALGNSCAMQWTKKGDMRSIPFADNFFDVVFSRTAVGYFPEADTTQVIAEFRRVGTNQHHTIDMDSTPPAYGYMTIKNEKWWNKHFSENKG